MARHGGEVGGEGSEGGEPVKDWDGKDAKIRIENTPHSFRCTPRMLRATTSFDSTHHQGLPGGRNHGKR